MIHSNSHKNTIYNLYLLFGPLFLLQPHLVPKYSNVYVTFHMMSNRHPNLHMSKAQLLVFAHKPAPPEVFPTSVKDNLILPVAQVKNPGSNLNSTPSFTPHIQSAMNPFSSFKVFTEFDYTIFTTSTANLLIHSLMVIKSYPNVCNHLPFNGL